MSWAAGAAGALFPTGDPVGQPVSIGHGSFTVIGVMKPSHGNNLKAQSSDDNVFLPLHTSKVRFGEGFLSTRGEHVQNIQLSRFILMFREEADLQSTAAAIRSMLRPFHQRGGVKTVVVFPQREAR